MKSVFQKAKSTANAGLQGVKSVGNSAKSNGSSVLKQAKSTQGSAVSAAQSTATSAKSTAKSVQASGTSLAKDITSTTESAVSEGKNKVQKMFGGVKKAVNNSTKAVKAKIKWEVGCGTTFQGAGMGNWNNESVCIWNLMAKTNTGVLGKTIVQMAWTWCLPHSSPIQSSWRRCHTFPVKSRSLHSEESWLVSGSQPVLWSFIELPSIFLNPVIFDSYPRSFVSETCEIGPHVESLIFAQHLVAPPHKSHF